MPFRVEKVSSTIRNAIGEIFINKITDPDLRTVSISNLIIGKDLKIAKIYVSSFRGEPDEILEKLKKAKGFIRKELSKSLYLKYLPDLQFFYDSAFEFDQKKVE